MKYKFKSFEEIAALLKVSVEDLEHYGTLNGDKVNFGPDSDKLYLDYLFINPDMIKLLKMDQFFEITETSINGREEFYIDNEDWVWPKKFVEPVCPSLDDSALTSFLLNKIKEMKEEIAEEKICPITGIPMKDKVDFNTTKIWKGD